MSALFFVVTLLGSLNIAWGCALENFRSYCYRRTIRGTIGTLNLDCSGEDYIVTLDTEGVVNFRELSIFAECSTQCAGPSEPFYYYDLSSLKVVRGINWSLNGSSELDMPPTSESTYCRIFGCFQGNRGEYFRFNGASCFPSNTTMIPHTEFITDFTAEKQESSGDYYNNNNITGNLFNSNIMKQADEELSSTTDSFSPSAPMSKDEIAAIVITVIFIIFTLSALLLMTLCFINVRRYSKSNKMQLQNIEVLYDIDPNDDLIVDVNGDRLFPLSAATSQITIFNGFSNRTAIPEKPSSLNFDREASYSLVSSSYFKMGETNSPLSLCEMGLSDRGDVSSAGSKSDVTEELELEDEQLLDDELMQGDTDGKKSNDIEQCNPIVVSERSLRVMASTTPLSVSHTMKLAHERAQEFESGSRQGFALNHLESEIISNDRKQPSMASGYIANGQSMANCPSLETVVPSEVTETHNLAMSGSDYLANRTNQEPIRTRVPMVESEDVAFLPSPKHGYVDNTGVHVRPTILGDRITSQQMDISDTIINRNQTMAIGTDTKLGSDYLPNTTNTAAIPAIEKVGRNLTDTPTSDQRFLGKYHDESNLCEHQSQLSVDHLKTPSSSGACELAQPLATAEIGNDSGYVSNGSERYNRTIDLPSSPPTLSPIRSSVTHKGTNNRTAVESGTDICKSNRDYISNASDLVLDSCERQDHKDDITTANLIVKDFLSEQNGGNGSSLPDINGVNSSDDTLHGDYISLPPTCDDQGRRGSLKSTDWRSSDELSLNLEAVEYNSEVTEDSDAESIDIDYSTSDNEQAIDDLNEENEPTEMQAEVKQLREGYIRSDLTIGSDSIQFYFPYRNANHHQPQGLCAVFDNHDSSSNGSPDYPKHNMAGVSDYHFNYPTSTLSEDQPAYFSAFTTNMTPQSAFTSTSDLELAQHSPAAPLDSESSGDRKIYSLMNTKLNVINYSFDREDGLNDADGNDGDVNFSFT